MVVSAYSYFCIVFGKWSTDEKAGLTVSFKESTRLINEAKEREAQMQNKLKAAEQQVQMLKERDQEVNAVLPPHLYGYFIICLDTLLSDN